MKKMKKILAFVMAMAMVLGMSLTSFAANTNTTEAQIEGIEAELKDGQNTICVKGYQIIRYDEKGAYAEVISGTIDKDADGNLAPTAANALALAKRKAELGNPVEFTANADGVYTASSSNGLTAGTWLVLVEGSSKYFYNPIIISVEQGADGLKYGTLNLATDTWLGSDGTTTLYAKKSEPTITKTAEKEKEGDTEVVGTQVGDILKFTVSADIPGYITGSTGMKYSIKDVLTGLSLVKDDEHMPVATVGGSTDTTLTDAVNTAIVNDAASFTVMGLGDTFLTTNAGKQIVITYYAKVTSAAKINVDELNNTATLSYSTNDSTEEHEKEAETKHYTFGIDTGVNGTIGEETINKTGEFVKINADGKIEYIESTELIEKGEKTEVLQGAEFELHIGAADGPKFGDKFTTDASGRLEINGLDSDVDYYLVETKAPTGYTINDTPIKVRITALFDASDSTKLTGYTVAIGEGENQAITHYGYSTETKKTVLNTENNASNPFGFKNTKLSSLPSTGGIGTTIFTIGGCAIMIVAAGLYFASRRKSSK